MGKRGPKKQAEAVPDDQLAIPTCPAWIGAQGKVWWKRITKAMLARKTITDADREIVAMVCSAADLHHEAVVLCKNKGLYCTGNAGSEYTAPWVGTRTTSWNQIVKGLAQLGLTPASRQDVNSMAKPEDLLSDFTD